MRTENAQHWISKTVESTYNTAESTGSNYQYIPTRDAFYQLPQIEKTSDADRIGIHAPSHFCNTYWSNPEYGIKDDAETGVPGRLLRRALGGSVTKTTVDTGVYKHAFGILNPTIGQILPSFGMASLLGDASFLFHGCMADRVKFSQQGSQRVQFEADVVGSGKFTNPHGLTSLPALAETPCMDGFRTVIEYYDPVADDTIVLSDLGTVVEWMLEHRNNIRRNKRRVGDPIQTVDSTGSAAYVKAMPRGKYETTASLKVDFTDLDEWEHSCKNTVMQDLTIKVVGPIIATTYRHEIGLIIPRCVFSAVAPDDDEGDAATMITVTPLADSVTGGTMTGYIQNGDSVTLA